MGQVNIKVTGQALQKGALRRESSPREQLHNDKHTQLDTMGLR